MPAIPSSMDADMVRQQIRHKMWKLGVNQAEYARMCGYAPQILSNFLTGHRPNPLKCILEAEGLRKVVYYEPIDS